jgi:hypothetical protein
VDWILLTSKQRRPLLFSIYAIIHTITLVMVTITLLLNAMPAPIVSAMPLYLQQMRYTEELEKNMCREDGFGWDEHWLDQCRSGFIILSAGAACVGLAMTVAQWWAMLETWSWLASRSNGKRNGEKTVRFRKASLGVEKEGLEVIKEV